MHGANCAVAHLHFEAVLAKSGSASSAQAGRPYIVTDDDRPLRYGDIWFLLETLSVTPFRTVALQPVMILLLSYVIEAYSLAPVRFPLLRKVLPVLRGDVKHLKPALFTVTTHAYATNEAVGRPVSEGGLGYKGLVTTLEGMCQELVDWNQDHADMAKGVQNKYVNSVALADEIEKLRAAAASRKG